MKLHLLPSHLGLTRLESVDDITMGDFQDGRNPLEPLLGPAGYAGTVLLDLARSTYIDSTGVGWLIQCHARFNKAGGKLVLHSIPPMVNHCFRVLGMYDVLRIADDEASALKLVEASLPPQSAPVA
jgi:anti-anti-sigma factor